MLAGINKRHHPTRLHPRASATGMPSSPPRFSSHISAITRVKTYPSVAQTLSDGLFLFNPVVTLKKLLSGKFHYGVVSQTSLRDAATGQNVAVFNKLYSPNDHVNCTLHNLDHGVLLPTNPKIRPELTSVVSELMTAAAAKGFIQGQPPPQLSAKANSLISPFTHKLPFQSLYPSMTPILPIATQAYTRMFQEHPAMAKRVMAKQERLRKHLEGVSLDGSNTLDLTERINENDFTVLFNTTNALLSHIRSAIRHNTLSLHFKGKPVQANQMPHDYWALVGSPTPVEMNNVKPIPRPPTLRSSQRGS